MLLSYLCLLLGSILKYSSPIDQFVFMNNQNIYVQSALQSSLLGVAIAFVVLLISTHVFHIAFFASISIICVLISVVGVMVGLN